jgi:hypothetical protein
MKQGNEYSLILQPSALGGIGVFTTHDFPQGSQIFSGTFSPRKLLIKDIPSAFLKYCIYLNDEECLCPERFDRMEIGWYLNHSDQPNIIKQAENLIVSTRDIKAGEEILIDYNHLNEPEHLKEAYYKPLT